MKAIDFIKNNGVDKAREVVEGAPDGATHIRDSYGYVAYLKDGVRKEWYHNNTWLMTLVWKPDYLLSDLKRLVESVDFINKFGGIDLAKAYDKQMIDHGFDPFFDKAIADYEAVGGEHV